MPKAVRFDSYGGVDVLGVRDAPRPVQADGEVLVEVRADLAAKSINLAGHGVATT
jgi:NADPH:quinone reductase-like Zn-dependent oxidoreductase